MDSVVRSLKLYRDNFDALSITKNNKSIMSK